MNEEAKEMRLSRTAMEVCPPKRYYQALVYEQGKVFVVNALFTTKSEAMNEIMAFKKNYNGVRGLDCSIRFFDNEAGEIIDYVNL